MNNGNVKSKQACSSTNTQFPGRLFSPSETWKNYRSTFYCIFHLVWVYPKTTLQNIRVCLPKMSFTHHWTSKSKNITSLSSLIFLSKYISLYASGRLKWILDIIWPFNQHCNLKNQRNWIKQVLMMNFLNDISCILLHWQKKTTLAIEFLIY